MKIEGVGEWLTLVGAAEKLGKTRWQVYHYIRRHKVPTTSIGKTTLVRLSDLTGLRKEKVGSPATH